MSLVTLKRKSRRFKAPISGRGTNGFSLNGGLRSQGWVGQTNIGRANIGTSFRGAFPMGNGGCCGGYVINTQNSGGSRTNDPDIIKRSTMNTKGLIEATVEHPTVVFNEGCTDDCNEGTICKSRCKTNWVKNMSAFAFSSGEQIKWKKITAASKNLPWSVKKKTQGIKGCPSDCDGASYWIGGKHYIREPYAKDLNLYSISPSIYQQAGLMTKEILPTPKCKAPFPFVLNHSATCQVNFKTPQDAINAGALPSDWLACEHTPNCCYPCGNRGFRDFVLEMESQPMHTSPPLKELFYSTGQGWEEVQGTRASEPQEFPKFGKLGKEEEGIIVDCDMMHIMVIRGAQPDGNTDGSNIAWTAALFEATKPMPSELPLTLVTHDIEGLPNKEISLGKGYPWPSHGYAEAENWDHSKPFEFKMKNGKKAVIYFWNTSGLTVRNHPSPMSHTAQKDLYNLLSYTYLDSASSYKIKLRLG